MSAPNPQEWEINNLPNRLTIFRVLLIPLIIGSMFMNTLSWDWVKPWHLTLSYVAAWTFVAASITDFFDGYIARKRNIVTVFGSFLDPIADKFLVISSLIMLQELGRLPGLLVVVLVLRELYITALRLLATERGLNVPVGQAGKWKTATQMVGIPLLMAFDRPWGIPMPELGFGLIAIASLLSVFSALEYSLGLLRKLKAKRKMAHERAAEKPVNS